MGTSASGKGSGANSSLVPPWADPDPSTPIPPADPGRFRAYRSSLGSYVKHGDPADLHRALGHFARTATGGARVAPRRFGSVSLVGGRLVGLLSEMRAGGSGEASTNANFDALRGKSVDLAVQEIARILTPPNGDASKIYRSIQLALSLVVEGMEMFDPSVITDDLLIDMLIVYVRESLFEVVLMESGKAFQKTDDLDEVLRAESGLRALVSVCVDTALRPLVANGIASMSVEQLFQAQQQALRDIWAEWETN